MTAHSEEIYAWHYQRRQPVCVRWRGGEITSVDVVARDLEPGTWIVPSLVDLQINGYAGVDFQQDHLTLEDLLRASRALRDDGCQRWLLTLITDDWDRLMARLGHLRRLRDRSPELRQSILGWHVEGPFLSAEPGFAGAHPAGVMCDPKPEHLHALRRATGNDPVLLTMAPERSGAIEAIRLAVSLGITVSLGHSNASAAQLQQAVDAGARGFTHLGNGCLQELNRHDNIIWRVLDTPGLTVSFIVDQHHVSPAFLRLAHRVLKPERVYYITDAMAAAGAPPGRYRLGSLAVEVNEDQVVRRPGTPFFAGSALRPIEGIQRAAQMLHRSWQEVWPHYCEVPARMMDLAWDLAAGRPATFYLLQVSADNRIQRLQTVSEGRWVGG